MDKVAIATGEGDTQVIKNIEQGIMNDHLKTPIPYSPLPTHHSLSPLQNPKLLRVIIINTV
jgi:hypothetical protein